MSEEKKYIRPVIFRFYGNCRETARLRTFSVNRFGSEQSDLEAAFIEARRHIVKPRLIHHP